MLSLDLSNQLAALDKRSQADFRHLLAPYANAFKAVTEQVSVHCAERGELLETLRRFYTQQQDVTARLAERSVRAELRGELDALTEQVIALIRPACGQLGPPRLRRPLGDRQLSEQRDSMYYGESLSPACGCALCCGLCSRDAKIKMAPSRSASASGPLMYLKACVVRLRPQRQRGPKKS